VHTIAGEPLDGWVFAQELRRSLIPPAEAAASAPAATAPAHAVVARAHGPQQQPARPSRADDAGRRFGRRL
jgi:phosphate-selective porin